MIHTNGSDRLAYRLKEACETPSLGRSLRLTGPIPFLIRETTSLTRKCT